VTGGWKFTAIEPVLDVISKWCQDLRGLNMTGWKGLNSEHLKFLIAKCPLLSRLDLSSINVRIAFLIFIFEVNNLLNIIRKVVYLIYYRALNRL
jgi:hypothetical protein